MDKLISRVFAGCQVEARCDELVKKINNNHLTLLRHILSNAVTASNSNVILNFLVNNAILYSVKILVITLKKKMEETYNT